MTGEEILRSVRGLLDDEEEEYLWEDWELIEYLNQSMLDFVRGTRILHEASTVSICQVTLLANLGIYSLDRTILTIEGGRLALTPAYPLDLKSRQVLDDIYPNWKTSTGTPRYIVMPEESINVLKAQFVPKYFTNYVGEVLGSSNISFVAGTKKITMATGVFTSHFAVGNTFNVSGTTNNNGYFTVASVIDTEITVNETLVDESLTSATLRKVEDTATLDVTRVPVTEFTLQNIKTLEPEMPWMYHRDLYDGMRGYAYSKQDSDTFDEKAAEKYTSKFLMRIEFAKREIVRRKSKSHVLTPHPGTI